MPGKDNWLPHSYHSTNNGPQLQASLASCSLANSCGAHVAGANVDTVAATDALTKDDGDKDDDDKDDDADEPMGVQAAPIELPPASALRRYCFCLLSANNETVVCSL